MNPAQILADTLSPLGVDVFVGNPPDPAHPPYVFVWAKTPTPHASDLAQTHADIDERIGITCVHTTVHNALRLCEKVTALLHNQSPRVGETTHARIRIVDTQPIQLDRSVKATNNRFPAYGVLTARIEIPREQL